MKQTTLCFLINDKNGEILLAMKKKGFGAGKWNGVGGKFDLEKGDKNIFDTAVRETKEEIKVDAKEIEKVAVINFRFPYKKEWNQNVHVFLIRNWIGDPMETEEMAPKWFLKNELPYNSMWDDDKYWMPKVLGGKKFKADFVFKEGEFVNGYHINAVKEI